MHDQSLNLLREAGLTTGSAMVDFGCGTADLAFEVAQEVGPVGKVLGVDCNPSLIVTNKQKTKIQAVDNLNFRIGLAEDYSDIFLYDICFARFLMAHCDSPGALIKNMLSLTKNYGMVAVEDVDINTMTSSPFCPELEVLKTLIATLVRHNGGDATVGPNLSAIMHWEGVRRIKVFEHQPCGSHGPIKQIPLRVLESIKPLLLRLGLATPELLTRLSVGLQQLAEDNSITIYFPKIYQVIGRNSHYLKFGPSRFTSAI